MTDQPVRPRYGQIEHRDGTKTPVLFRPTDDPTVFEGVEAGSEQPIAMGRGDRLHVDVIGAGQAITFGREERL